MNAALDAAEADLPKDSGALLITTVGARAFSAGFDLDIMGNADADPAQRQELLDAGVELCFRLYLFRRPLVLAISGHALALGGLLALCGDLRIGTTNPKTQIGLPEIQIGMQLPVFGVKLAEARLNTPSDYNRAVILADSFSTAEAVSAGFLDRVVEEEELAEVAAAEAARLGEHCGGGFGQTKLYMREPMIEYVRSTGQARI